MPRRKPPAKPTPGQLVRQARLAKALTQADLAKLVGVGQPAISDLENDRVENLSRGNLLIVAVTLGLDARLLDPSLEGIYCEVGDLARGRVTLLRVGGDPAAWTAEGDGIEGAVKVRDTDIGRFMRGLAERGIEVTAPAFPPVE